MSSYAVEPSALRTDRWHVPRQLAIGRWPSAAWLTGAFALALAPRLALLALNQKSLQFFEYETLADNVAAGSGYVIPRFGHVAFAFGDGNLYSFLASTVYLVVGHQPVVLAVLQALVASLAPPAIFAIGDRAFGDKRIAGGGAVLAALHPGLLAYTTKLHPLGMDVLLMSLSVLWLLRLGEGRGRGLMAGFTLGMTLMSRPTFFVAGLVALAVRTRGARRFWAPSVTALAVVAVVAAPWVARNWLVLGRPVFVSTSLEDVWKGNNSFASGSSYVADGRDVFAAAPPELRARFQQPNELALNEVFAQEITTFVREQPGQFASLVARKFVYFWWLPPTAGLLYPGNWLVPYQLYAGVVYLFALIGAVAAWRSGSVEARMLLRMVVAVGLCLAVIHALAYIEGRHRWGIEPLLLLFTANGLFVALTALRRRWAQPGRLARHSST